MGRGKGGSRLPLAMGSGVMFSHAVLPAASLLPSQANPRGRAQLTRASFASRGWAALGQAYHVPPASIQGKTKQHVLSCYRCSTGKPGPARWLQEHPHCRAQSLVPHAHRTQTLSRSHELLKRKGSSRRTVCTSPFGSSSPAAAPSTAPSTGDEKESLHVARPSIARRGRGDVRKGEPATSSDRRQRNYEDLFFQPG